MSDAPAYDIAVLGAGIAGASAAAELAPYATVLCLEMESQPGYHSTGRSAATLAQTYGSSVIRELTRASGDFFHAPPAGFAEDPLLSPRPLIRIARPDQVAALRRHFDGLEDAAGARWIDGAEVEAHAPHLRKGYAVGGFINEEAQDIDVHKLHHGYIAALRRAGGTLLTGHEVDRLQRRDGRWSIETRRGTFTADIVVDAAGAWAETLGTRAGAAPIGLVPKRRSAITVAAPEGAATAGWPMVVDAEEEFYLKPESGRLLASPAEETASLPCDCRPEEIDIAICVDRIQRAFALTIRRIESQWAGLRSFVADRAPVCGFDPGLTGFFWLAGQGGYGVQTAPALARLTAALVLDRPWHDALDALRPRLAEMAPGRDGLKA